MNQDSNPAGNPRVSEPRIAGERDPVRIDESEFGRFEELAGKLVNVPKTELDEQRKGES
jgi:hypothetical protein